MPGNGPRAIMSQIIADRLAMLLLARIATPSPGAPAVVNIPHGQVEAKPPGRCGRGADGGRRAQAGDRPRSGGRGVRDDAAGDAAAIAEETVPKGEVLATARVAGILAAKRCGELIPLCHPLPIDSVAVDFELLDDRIRITAAARVTAKTGVEMEALTAVSVAALTIYDMCKAIDKSMVIES